MVRLDEAKEGNDSWEEEERTVKLLNRLDGFIEPDFFERKACEWRQTQKRLADQIADYENATGDYLQDGVRLLELANWVAKEKGTSSSDL